jgi:hypothetical protein
MNILFILPVFCHAEELISNDPYSNSLGNISFYSRHKDNPSLLSNVAVPELILTGKNHYFTSELNDIKVSFLLPMGWSTASFFFEGYGYKHYNNLIGGFQLAKLISSSFSLGTGIQIRSLYYTGSDKRKYLIVPKIGMNWTGKEFLFSLWADNLLGKRYSSNFSISCPVRLMCGFRVFFNEEVQWGMEVENNDFYYWRVKSGFEYQVEHFAIRCGLYTAPLIPTLGIGFSLSDFMLDLAMQYHNQLGISLSYGLKWNLK